MEKSIESLSHHSSEISPPYKVGYFIYQTNFFPPARGRTALLRGHEQLNSDKFDFFFYNTGLYRNTTEKFETFMERQLPEVTFRSWQDYFDENRSLGYEVGQLEVAEKLLEQVRRDDIDIAIYAKEQMCGYLAIARAAPIQVFHSHGSIEFLYNHIDGYQNYFNSMKEWDEHENVNFFRYPMLEEFLYPKKDDEKYNQIKQKFDKFDFLYGCLDRLKKLENEKFLGTVRQILEKNPDSAFIIVGRGDATEILNYFEEHDLDKRVFYEGYTDSPRSYQRALDVCLAPFPEFGGRAQIEFMANRTPVVSLSFQNSEDPELANYPRTEMVEDIYGIEGLYVDDGDTDKYVEIATRLNKDNEFYDESCERTYRTFQRRFDIKKAAKKCEDFYTELIEQKRSG
jgi:glycosyltransferase involved in cell wall biosynthesis